MSTKTHRRLDLLETKARKLRIKGLKGGGVSADINITPLVDVVLVLLIIFMLILPEVKTPVALPEAFSPDKVLETTGKPINIAIKCVIDKSKKPERCTQKSIIFINELELELKQNADASVNEAILVSALEEAKSENPLAPVYMSIDRRLKFITVRLMLSALRDAGLTQAGLVAKRIIEREN